MQVYDIIMLVVLAAATMWGLWKGLIWQLASLASMFLSYFVAYTFRDQLAAYIDVAAPWNVFLAMLLLFVGTSALVWTTCHFFRTIISRMKLKEFDHQIGGLLGAATGVVLCVVITLFAVTLLGQSEREKIINSRSGHYIALLLERAHTILPKEVRDVLHPHLHEVLDGTADEPPLDGLREVIEHHTALDEDGLFHSPR